MPDPPADTTEPPRPPTPAPAGYSPREVGGAFIALLGVAIVASGLVLNPWVGRLVQGPDVVDKADVLLRYFAWSVGLGMAVVLLGARFSRQSPGALDGLVALALPVVAFVLVDCLLLVHFGLPLWGHDPVLGYRHRPGIVRSLSRTGHPGDFIRINRHGHHDTDYDVEKPTGELRGLMIGDSITMGDQLPYAETFSAQLEALLAEHDPPTRAQMINTGVHGYTTLQELEVLRDGLRFDPDFVAIGFCMNDVTEPSVVRRGVEEGGADYHRVAKTSNPVRGWLLNDTGLGRLSQVILSRSKTLTGERYREGEAVRRMAALPADHPEVAEAWRFVTQDLEAMYAAAREHGAEVVLMIFPFTFQLGEPSLHHPQAILGEHAARHGVPSVDFTPIFADLIHGDRALLELMHEQGFDEADMERAFLPRIRRYFLDKDHLTEAGHRVVAERLLEHLIARGLVAPSGDPLP